LEIKPMTHQHANQTKTAENTRASQPSAEAKAPAAPALHPMLQLQQQIGNWAVGRLIQAKLTVGEANDVYEQEADRVAAAVVSQIHAPQTPSAGQNTSVQRQVTGKEEELQTKPLIQCKSDVGGMAVSAEIESTIQQARGGGQPLAESIRTPMEQAFGTDFSGVRVHTDTQSHQLNQSIQAKAFTTGQDIFFRKGEYSPSSRGGQELLAHELTHVVQQNVAAARRMTKLLPPGQSSTNQVVQRTRMSKGIEYATDAEDAIKWFEEHGRNLDDYPLEEAESAINFGCEKEYGLSAALKILGSDAASRLGQKSERLEAIAQTKTEWGNAFGNTLAGLVFDAWMTGYEDLRWNLGVEGTYTDIQVQDAIDEIDEYKAQINDLTNVHYYRRQDKAAIGKGNVGATLARRGNQANFIAKVCGLTVNVHVDLV
jgi:hypothetical protein